MHRKTWLTLAATAALAAGSALAASPPDSGGPGPGGHRKPHSGMEGHEAPMMGMNGPRMLERMASELGLSADQQQRIKAVQESERPGMQQLRDELRSNAERLRNIQPDDPSYAAVVAETSKKAGELTARMLQGAARMRAQVWQVLTSEQRVKMAAMQAERRERMQQRRQRHAEGGNNPGRR